MKFCIFLFAATILFVQCSTKKSADLLVINGNIHSLGDSVTVYEAMAIRDGKVAALGTVDELQKRFHQDSTLDLKGRHVFPGFIDAHCHLFGLGEQELIVDLIGTKSPTEVIERIKQQQHLFPVGTWIRGRGWDQNDWETTSYPTKDLLDLEFPDIPVFLSRVDGHAAWVNSKALELAGITPNTPDPAGGKIFREKGVLTGILIDEAVELIKDRIPKRTPEELRTGYTLAIQRCLEYGITGVHDMGLDTDNINAIISMIEDDVFPLRAVAYADGKGETWEALLAGQERTYGDHQLVLAGLKLYADGALGSRGALLLEPYTDDLGNHGVQITSEEDITTETVRAINNQLQVCVHAIGDSANRLALNAYEKAISQTEVRDHRLRIEHVQVLHPLDIPRFSELGVIPSMQPTHCTSDMYWAEARLGTIRIKGAYVWQSLLQTGVMLPFGSDFPVEHPNPLLGIYAGCTRQDIRGIPETKGHISEHFILSEQKTDQESRYQNGWYAVEKVSRMQALKGFTSDAAKAAKQEHLVGSLQPGTYADFFICKENILTCSAQKLATIPVLATYVGGKKVYKSKNTR